MKIIILMLLSIVANADEFYLKNPPSYRYLGNDQGNVGSCQSEADVTAIENIFWHNGFAVQLSTIHRHNLNWVNDKEREESGQSYDLKLRINDQDKQLLAKLGGVIPHYMLPDNSEGFLPDRTGYRPHISDIIAYDPEYKPFNVNMDGFSFMPGYSNTISISSFKSMIKQGVALSLSINGYFLMGGNFDDRTGMMKNGVDIASYAKGEISHAVAVVGFDDSLYEDYGFSEPGAIIIKNSWNDNPRKLNSLENHYDDYSANENLFKMKYKISPNKNLPGYYAIPYQLIKNAIEAKVSMFVRKYNIDYAGFAEQYYRLKDRYSVIVAPYSCGTVYQDKLNNYQNEGFKLVMSFGNSLLELLRPSLEAEVKEKLSALFMKMLNVQVSPRSESTFRIPQFKYAYFSQHKLLNIDRAEDFYSGKYNDYFCFANGTEENNQARFIYPNINHYKKSKIQEDLKDLSSGVFAIVNWWNFLRDLFVLEVNREVPSHIFIN